MNIYEEEEYLEEQLANGEISLKEFNTEIKELHREYKAMAEEAAQEAYDDVMDNW